MEKSGGVDTDAHLYPKNQTLVLIYIGYGGMT
jgi:hypothetical protein